MNKNRQNILVEPIVGKPSSRLVASSAHKRYHALCERDRGGSLANTTFMDNGKRDGGSTHVL